MAYKHNVTLVGGGVSANLPIIDNDASAITAATAADRLGTSLYAAPKDTGTTQTVNIAGTAVSKNAATAKTVFTAANMSVSTQYATGIITSGIGANLAATGNVYDIVTSPITAYNATTATYYNAPTSKSLKSVTIVGAGAAVELDMLYDDTTDALTSVSDSVTAV